MNPQTPLDSLQKVKDTVRNLGYSKFIVSMNPLEFSLIRKWARDEVYLTSVSVSQTGLYGRWRGNQIRVARKAPMSHWKVQYGLEYKSLLVVCFFDQTIKTGYPCKSGTCLAHHVHEL